MAQVNAFLARSFDSRDEQRIRPILEFLNTFHKAGFICETAEQAEVELVSEKVQRMIDQNDVFIGFFTRRHAVHDLRPRISGAWNALRRKFRPKIWTAPAWVLQESGYALKAKGRKKLILLREEGVETFGLQGDLEYIPFDANNPSAVFPKLSEMINGLLAQAAGIEVKTTVSERREHEQVAAEPSATEASDTPKTASGQEDMLTLLIDMKEASEKGDFDGIYKAWDARKKQAAARGGGEFDELRWDCLYFRLRFQAGDATGLEQLKRLGAENSARPQPLVALAYCFQNTDAFVEAGGLFLEAAELSEGDDKARRLLEAASAFREAKEYEQAKKAVRQAVEVASKELQEELASAQYKVLKDCGEQYFAFAVAESALQDNAQLSLRFDLGLDYYREGRNELGLFHFKFLCDRNKRYAGALHNLALLYSESKLPISAVDQYKKAIDLGETLASANLGYLYLDAGMTRETEELVERARKVEGHDPNVEKCSAAIVERREEEKSKELELLQQAADERRFFVEMGRGMSAVTPPLNGRWRFPFGEMPLTLAGDELAGTAEITREDHSLSRLLAVSVLSGSSGGTTTRAERYTLQGKLTGAVCKFELVKSSVGMPTLSDMAGPKSGFVVFAPDGKTADYVELAGRKFGKVEKLVKVG